MTDIEFQVKYVHPFYLELMNLNFLRKSEQETYHLFDNLSKLSNELSDVIIIEMLNGPWRPSKVGAWMIYASNKIELKHELAKYLSKEAIQYSEHVLFSLLLIDEESSVSSITKFIERQIKWYLRTKDFINLERLSIDWGISILGYLDGKNETLHIEKIQSANWWSEFDENLKELRYYDEISKRFKPKYHFNSIDLLFKRIKKDDNNGYNDHAPSSHGV